MRQMAIGLAVAVFAQAVHNVRPSPEPNMVVYITPGGPIASIPVREAAFYLGAPAAFVSTELATPATPFPELSFVVRAWKEAGKARVIVYASLLDKRAPGGRTETPISTFAIAPKEALEVKEAHAWGVRGLVVSADTR